MRQNNIFGDDETPADVAEMALFISENNRSPAKLTKVFQGMADTINYQATHSATKDLIGELDTIGIMDIFRQAAGIIPAKQSTQEPLADTKKTGGFVDLFTETKGQKKDREQWQTDQLLKKSLPLILCFNKAA